jgi:hypothetical protein
LPDQKRQFLFQKQDGIVILSEGLRAPVRLEQFSVSSVTQPPQQYEAIEMTRTCSGRSRMFAYSSGAFRLSAQIAPRAGFSTLRKRTEFAGKGRRKPSLRRGLDP